MNVTKNRVLVAVGCAVVVAVGFVLFGVVQGLGADPVVVDEAAAAAGVGEGEGEAPAEAPADAPTEAPAEAAASVSE
jgi:hypothetical protein